MITPMPLRCRGKAERQTFSAQKAQNMFLELMLKLQNRGYGLSRCKDLPLIKSLLSLQLPVTLGRLPCFYSLGFVCLFFTVK